MTTENLCKLRPRIFGYYANLKSIFAVIIPALLIVSFFAPRSHANAPEIDAQQIVTIDKDDGFGPVNSYITAYTERGSRLTLQEVISLAQTGQFKPLETRVPDFGYFDKGIWLKFRVKNPTPDKLEQFLLMHTNFMRSMDLYFVTDSKFSQALHQDATSKFGSRPIQYHQLVAPLDIPASTSGDIYIRYTSEGSTNMPISLQTPVSFAQTTNFRVTIDFVFYGIMSVLIFASLLGRIFWRNPTFIAYAFYAASVLLYIFQRDGYAFQYLWPNAPQWNNFSSLPLGASLIIFAAFFTRAYLYSNKLHPVIDKILIGIIIMQITVVASAIFIGSSNAKQLAIMTTMIGILIYFCIGIAAYRKYGRRTLFFVIGWLGILFASISVTLIHWTRIEILGAESLDLMRAAMIFDSFMLGLASVVSIVEIQKDRQRLVSEHMNTLSTNLDLHNRLGRLEQKYHFMQNFAERANQSVVDTKHDLRQPLFALRSAISDLTESNDSTNSRSEIEESLNYIEGMVETVFEEAIEQGEVTAPRKEDGAEHVKVDKLFSSLFTMFKNEAENNNITLKTIGSSHSVYVAPFPVLRVFSNFITNAIRYAPGARVTIGAKREGDHLSLEVHDTGPGMTEAELDVIKNRYHRGSAAQNEKADAGLGLGLSIVEKLAKENQLEWSLESRKGHGTIAKIKVKISE